MKMKKGVSFDGASPVILRALADVDELAVRLGYCFVVTSVCDGRHRVGSYHYSGRAFDFRTRHLSVQDAVLFVKAVRVLLGMNFDVIYEDPNPRERFDGEHGHVEFTG